MLRFLLYCALLYYVGPPLVVVVLVSFVTLFEALG